MLITIMGTGYVGLVTGVCFAELGWKVTCVDTNHEIIRTLKRGNKQDHSFHFYEPGLGQRIAHHRSEGRLRFSIKIPKAIRKSQAVFIAVGTPERPDDGSANLDYIFRAARTVAKNINKFTVVVIKSTVPVGTGRKVEQLIREVNPKANFAMASNPEFLREGSAIQDFMNPDRVVVGVENPRAKAVLAALYRPLKLLDNRLLFTSIPNAELIKYAANAFLATKITFINQIANLCEAVEADVKEVALGIGLDTRIGKAFLAPGPGYGGSCFPKDTKALIHMAHEVGTPITLLETVVQTNQQQKARMVDKIRKALDGTLQGRRIGILGLTFKANTDDMRDASSLTIIPELLAQGATVQAYDPKGMQNARALLPEILYLDDPYQVCADADALVILTEWPQFCHLKRKRIRNLMRPGADGRFVFCDLRNLYDAATMTKAGFRYVGVGRGV